MTNSASSTITFVIERMGCGACAAKIEKTVKALEGVSDISIDMASKQARIHFSAPAQSETIASAIHAAGYQTQILS